MVHLPRECPHCHRRLHHYAGCTCVDGRLEAIDTERRAIQDRLKRLDALEREILGLVPETE
jgi:hypothetical protein